MYQKILVALENSEHDERLIKEIGDLAHLLKSRLLLVHVADGWVARHYDDLKMAESEEMRADREYLTSTAERLRQKGVQVDTVLALGDPPSEILKTATNESCDMIAMTTHGHRLLGDLIFGSTIEHVRHASKVTLLIVRQPVQSHAK